MNPAEYPFLPAWPPAVTPLAWVAALLLLAIVAGEATRRWLRVSRVIGYLLAGVVLGPHAAGVLDADTLERFAPSATLRSDCCCSNWVSALISGGASQSMAARHQRVRSPADLCPSSR
jgi:hypothetical protein